MPMTPASSIFYRSVRFYHSSCLAIVMEFHRQQICDKRTRIFIQITVQLLLMKVCCAHERALLINQSEFVVWVMYVIACRLLPELAKSPWFRGDECYSHQACHPWKHNAQHVQNKVPSYDLRALLWARVKSSSCHIVCENASSGT